DYSTVLFILPESGFTAQTVRLRLYVNRAVLYLSSSNLESPNAALFDLQQAQSLLVSTLDRLANVAILEKSQQPQTPLHAVKTLVRLQPLIGRPLVSSVSREAKQQPHCGVDEPEQEGNSKLTKGEETPGETDEAVAMLAGILEALLFRSTRARKVGPRNSEFQSWLAGSERHLRRKRVLALCRRLREQVALASAHFRADDISHELEPLIPPSYRQLTSTEADLRKIGQVALFWPELQLSLAYCHHRGGRLHSVIQITSQLNTLMPGYPEALIARGNALMDLGGMFTDLPGVCNTAWRLGRLDFATALLSSTEHNSVQLQPVREIAAALLPKGILSSQAANFDDESNIKPGCPACGPSVDESTSISTSASG
ncbi:unnamed protein product, partial [Protopolystoma xenopodis]